MGFPLAPVLGYILMGFYESNQLNVHNLNKPKLCLRYADDILSPFEKEQDPLIFLNLLNNKHLIQSVSLIKISHFRHTINRPLHDF